jgi:hypothetical protein
VYERAKPEAEAGMGRLDNNERATPTRRRDQIGDAVTHAQKSRQLNAHDVVDERAGRAPTNMPPPRAQPDHSMKQEEPDGWDLAPTDIRNPRDKRHPRTQGKGGTR